MITSLTNEKIKEYAKLNQAKHRLEEGKYIVEGPHLVLEAKNAGVLLEVITTDEKTVGTLVSESVMKKLCNTVHPVKVIGICKMVNKNDLANKILVLDDSSSALDYKTDSLLRSAIIKEYNPTLFIISQRISSIMSLDHIMVLDEGRIIGYGTHEELMNTCSMYQDIYMTQMGEVANGD